MRFRNKYRGRGIPMFVWLPTVAGTIFAVVFIRWLSGVLDHREPLAPAIRICYMGRVIEGVPKCS